MATVDESVIPKTDETPTVEYGAVALDYAEGTFTEYEQRFVVIPVHTAEQAREMLDIFNKGIQDETDFEPVLYQRTATYGPWERVDNSTGTE